MTSLLEYLDSDCEITVLPHPKAPGMAVVPPCTHLHSAAARALDPVKDGAHDSRAELHRERLSRAEDGVADRHTGCGGKFKADDLSHQLTVADAHQLVHGGSRHRGGRHHC
ncbi:hypothetical protein EYF80_036453 [Liparis tanakae]|uniref:Uncharacterized protein n=1 Tax=Liparis tanakae TaxID=230148 RepID=A0A4Z2GIB7_9TELE|nr:hypothetical protein EYF80_036453 [Liparis tanakae]